MIELPVGLKHALEIGECVLFLGAGVGAHLHDEHGNPAPDAHDLAVELADTFDIDTKDFDLAKLAAYVEHIKGRAELDNFIKVKLSNLQPDSVYQWLFTLRWRAIFTTNYDNSILRAYDLIASPKQKPMAISSTSEIVSFDNRFEVPVYYLHGTVFGESRSSIVITRDDYSHYYERRRMLFELLKNEFATSTILYVGYSNRDPNWNNVLSEITSEFSPYPLPVAYRIVPNTEAIEKELLKAKNITTIDGSLQDFYETAIVSLSPSDVDSDRLQRAKGAVPTDLLDAFDKNPAAVLRLLGSWDYVNQSPFHVQANLFDFLRGDRPNWALVGTRKIFERDIEEDIFNTLLDYLVGSAKKPSTNVLVGPAGYGVTTLLMTIASRIALEKIGFAFALKPARPLIEGDIEFACSIFPDSPPFFFVDNAADYGDQLSSSIARLANLKRRAFFLLADRLNEWRQQRIKPSAREFALEPLSDPEINRLLDYLAENSALNKLENLSRELQFAQVKQRHLKELLVVMREATEGQSFDAILEGEFHGIGTSEARKLYLTVCCFHQHGAYIRADLLADLLGMSLINMYQATEDQTAGVVIYDTLDETRGINVARARHRTIAVVVWERCGEQSEKETILQSSLAKLNLNYRVDKIAFDDFVRSERLVDSIQTLEGRISFFEAACRKDPESAYVRQHYARMLYRSDRLELALSQIDQAIRLDPKVRILLHTKALILAAQAKKAESPELARRLLFQSEGLFKQGIVKSPHDDHFYHGLANLYFNWAKSTNNEEELADYLAKAEDTINAGLKAAKIRDSLWIVSSDIQKWLGNKPHSIRALENAVRENPNSIIARYLLGRAYRKMGQPKQAIEVLEPIIKNHSEEFRSFVEYALALEKLGTPYKTAIAILLQSTLYGFRDPRFIATLGGMYYLSGDFTEATKVFEESNKRSFTAKELNEIQYWPLDPKTDNSFLTLDGKVVVVKAGYALLETSSYPLILCPGTKQNGIVMGREMKLTFELAFSAKGSLAINPRIRDRR
jgi:tetratricopeptide (TPR) repeat protein